MPSTNQTPADGLRHALAQFHAAHAIANITVRQHSQTPRMLISIAGWKRDAPRTTANYALTLISSPLPAQECLSLLRSWSQEHIPEVCRGGGLSLVPDYSGATPANALPSDTHATAAGDSLSTRKPSPRYYRIANAEPNVAPPVCDEHGIDGLYVANRLWFCILCEDEARVR